MAGLGVMSIVPLDRHDELPRSSLAFYSDDVDDAAGVDLVHWDMVAPRLVRYTELIERTRAVEKVRPPKDLPPASSHPSVSPRTRVIARQLAARKPTDKGPVVVKKPVADILLSTRPASARNPAPILVRLGLAPAPKRPSSARAAAEAAAPKKKLAPDPRKAKAQAPPKSAPVVSNADREEQNSLDNILEEELKNTRAFIFARQGELNALRDLGKERQAAYDMLEGEYALMRQQGGVQGNDFASLTARQTELTEQLDDALTAMEEEEETNASYIFMQERMRLRRPHLERKLAYLHSLHIELAVRVEVQDEAMEVATAAGARMDARHEAAKAAFREQVKKHGAMREGLKSELFERGGAKRRALQPEKAFDDERLRRLEQVIAEDHAEMEAMAAVEAKAAEERAEATFKDKSRKAGGRAALPGAVANLSSNLETMSESAPTTAPAGGLFPGRRMGPREGWERLCILTEADSVKGVLEYWEDKIETRAALDMAEENSENALEKQRRELNNLNAQHLAARDLADSGRQAFDALLDDVDSKIAKAAATGRAWNRRHETVERRVGDAFSQLRRAVGICTSRSVLERIAQPAKGMLDRKGKQIEEVDEALAKMRVQSEEAVEDAEAPAMAPEAAASGGAVAASGISMAVAAVLGIDAESSNTGSVSETDLRAAQAMQLCSTTESALLQLIEMMKWNADDIPNRRPDAAPQLEGEFAKELNMRMPRRLPRNEMRSVVVTPDGKLSRSVSPPAGTRSGEMEAGTPADAPSASTLDAARKQLLLEEEDGLYNRHRNKVLDPITLAGQAEAEAEAEEELAAQLASGRAPEVEEGSEWLRDELKNRELKVLIDSVGKEEAKKRCYKFPVRKPKPPQQPRKTGGGRRVSVDVGAAGVAKPSAESLVAASPGASVGASAPTESRASRCGFAEQLTTTVPSGAGARAGAHSAKQRSSRRSSEGASSTPRAGSAPRRTSAIKVR